MTRKRSSSSSTNTTISTRSKAADKEEEGNSSDVDSESSDAQIISILQPQSQDNNVTEDDTVAQVDLKKEAEEKKVETKDLSPSIKKPRKSTPRKSRTKANDGFFNLPFDLFFEICGHLGSKDLLNFSISSKLLRELLLAKASEPFWIDARKRAGLPDLNIMPMTEIQYAYFVYSDICQKCGHFTDLQPDPFLRIKYCGECRQSEWTMVSGRRRFEYNDVYPVEIQATKCLITTECTAKEPKYSSWRGEEYYLKSDAEYYESLIKNLAIKDSKNRNRDLVSQFVEKRIAVAEGLKKEGKILQDALNSLFSRLYFEGMRDLAEKRRNASIRIAAIEKKVTELLGWDKSYFSEPKWKASKLLCREGFLTDAEWNDLEKPILRLLGSLKQARQVDIDEKNTLKRQDGLRLRYNSLQNDAGDFPVFGQWLLLPTVKGFWGAPEADSSSDAWDLVLDNIKKETEQYQTSVRIHAIKTILAATTLETYEDLNKFDDTYFSKAKFNSRFFNKPIHFLCCDLPGCYVKERYVEYRLEYGVTKGRLNHFSSLKELLRHQQLVHNDDRFSRCSPDQLFHLPEEVVYTLSGIIEVGLEVDDDTVTVAQLDNLGCRLQWSNSNAFKKTHTWRELIDAVYQKKKTLKKNTVLPIPTITLLSRTR